MMFLTPLPQAGAGGSCLHVPQGPWAFMWLFQAS